MKKIFICFIILSIAFTNQNSKVLVLSPYTEVTANYLDENDVSTISMLFVEGLNQYIDSIEESDISCSNDGCALEELSKTENDEVVYSRLQKLGSKIIFTASILDSDNSFDSKATALSIEDMDQVCLRLSKSIALRQTLEEAADIENITQEDEEEVARRESLGRVGFAAGYFVPFQSITHTDDYNGGDIRKYSSVFKMNWNYYHEFKNNTGLLFELGTAPPILSFLDMNFMKYQNKVDTSPFYGAGVGFYSVRKDDYSDNNYSGSDGGLCLNLQAGTVLYRTYNINVLLRAKFIQIFDEDFTNGIIFDIGVQWKVKSPKRGNQTVVVNRYPILERIFDRD